MWKHNFDQRDHSINSSVLIQSTLRYINQLFEVQQNTLWLVVECIESQCVCVCVYTLHANISANEAVCFDAEVVRYKKKTASE